MTILDRLRCHLGKGPNGGSFLGNFPQAFSHLGVIASGWKIARARRAEAGRS